MAGIALPQLAPASEDRASGAQVIDGSLRFDSAKSTKLERTPGSAGNRKTWTWSAWVKRSEFAEEGLFGAGTNGNQFFFAGFAHTDDKFYIHNGVQAASVESWANTTEVYRDIGWYHIVLSVDTTQSTDLNRVKLYINGVQQELNNYSSGGFYPSLNYDTAVNNTVVHNLGYSHTNSSAYHFDGSMTQVYLIDGQQLDASYFGFTDPLTNSWRPKKYSGTFGTNGFWLPMDGNSPIGLDESGNGNDWSPVNFGSTVGLDKATGALPILNTNSGGTVAQVGVRTDPHSAKLIFAAPLVSNANDLSNLINSGVSAKSATVTGNAAASSDTSNFYGGSFEFDSSGDYINYDLGVGGLGDGDFTIEFWAQSDVTSGARGPFQLSATSGGLTSSSVGVAVYQNGSGYYQMYADGSSSGDSTFKNDKDRWNHFAVVRSGNTQIMYINGVNVRSNSSTNDLTTLRYLCIGGYYSASYLWDGYIQDFRIYKGLAKYTSNFRVASTNPVVLPDTPSGVATKTKLTKIHEGSVEFDGTADYMTVASGAGFAFGTGDFSVECYAYSRNRGTNDYIIDGRNGSQTTGTWALSYGYAGGNGRIEFGTGSSTILECPANLNPEATQWHHIVVTRSGSTNRMFIDGVLAASATDSTNFSTEPTTSTIGGRYSTQHLYDGFISNIRVVKGSIPTEYQTSSTTVGAKIFTSPTSQLTNVTNTTLLCCHDPLSAVGSIVTPGSITRYGAAKGNTFNPFNTDINTIRGQETSHVTWNPLDSSNKTLSNGNLDAASTGSGIAKATIYLTSGKWFWEVISTNGYTSIGLAESTITPSSITWLGQNSTSGASYNYYSYNGQKYTNGSGSSYGATYTTGDVIGIALDLDEGILKFYKNGVDQGDAFTGLTGSYTPAFGNEQSGISGSANFGQKPFRFSPPDGFQALTGSSVRPEKVTPDGSQFFAAVPYTGNSATNKITTGFAPDFVWIKNRDDGYAHCLFDTVRGAGKRLESDANYGEDDYNLLNTFRDNGFTLGVQGGGGAFVQNTSGVDSMSWSWKAGGNKNTFNIDDVGYASASDVNMSVGGLNSVTYNQGSTNYTTSQITGDDYNSTSFGETNGMFDGKNTTIRAARSQNTFTWTTSIAVNTLRLMVHKEGGTTTIKITDDDGERNIASLFPTTTNSDVSNGNLTMVGVPVNGTLTKIEVAADPSGAGYQAGIAQVEIDGLILVDNGLTPPNVPSMAVTGASVNTKSKFGIYTFDGNSTNNTLHHGLGQQPDFMICKKKSTSGNSWVVWHSSIANTEYLLLNSYAAKATDATLFNSHASDSSTLWTIGSNTTFNETSQSSVAYLWCNVPGLQKFGTYEGNSSSGDGPFVELGFRPAMIMIHNIDDGSSAADWVIYDTARNTYNPAGKQLYPNRTIAEADSSSHYFDILSNGFKVRSTSSSGLTNSSDTFIYCAWAEAPAFNMFGASSNAR